ncbi:MAG: hypothetical protein K6B72_02100 [Lachnospiraceae bacterium]|nr:hypothetical protein [Lachnospiraceae bacterium]
MDKPEFISYYAHEAEMARSELHSKRMFVLWIVTFLSLILTNAGWMWYENQFEDVVTEVSQEVETGEGDAIVTGVGDIYGESKTDGQNEDPETENGR